MSVKVSVVTSLYHGADYLRPFLQGVQAQSVFEQLECLLVHNDPTDEELAILAEFQPQFETRLKHIVVRPVEPLGASWNRGWQAATGEYVAIWNVDDRRTPDSLARQLTALEADPEALLSYGDYLEVPAYGQEEGRRYYAPAFELGRFRREFASRGAFMVFRRALGEQLGYFDEQLEIGPDFELALRLAAHGHAMAPAEGLLGYFTNAEQGLSTRDGALRAAVERTVAQLRYGIYDKVRPEYRPAAEQYRLDAIKNFGEWLPLARFLPEHEAYLRARRPLWLLGGLRNCLRWLLARLGLLPRLYRLQERLLKREI